MFGDSQTRTLYAGVRSWMERVYGREMDYRYNLANEETYQACKCMRL